MSDLSNMEKRKLERALQMDEGYVLEFSNKTFNEFMNKTDNYLDKHRYQKEKIILYREKST